MLQIGIVCVFIGTVLMLATFVAIPKDKLPTYLKCTVDDGKFPPGIVRTGRAIRLWVSGGFWGVGAAVLFTEWTPEAARASFPLLLGLTGILCVLLLGVILIDRQK